MMSEAQLEMYRSMTPAERFRLGLELTDLGWRSMSLQGPEHLRRCLEALRREKEESNQAILEALERLANDELSARADRTGPAVR